MRSSVETVFLGRLRLPVEPHANIAVYRWISQVTDHKKKTYKIISDRFECILCASVVHSYGRCFWQKMPLQLTHIEIGPSRFTAVCACVSPEKPRHPCVVHMPEVTNKIEISVHLVRTAAKVTKVCGRRSMLRFQQWDRRWRQFLCWLLR